MEWEKIEVNVHKVFKLRLTLVNFDPWIHAVDQ